jgi:hypothetical protein
VSDLIKLPPLLLDGHAHSEDIIDRDNARGNSPPGMIIGSPWDEAPMATTDWVKAVDLDGANDWLQNATTWSALPDEFTMALWARFTAWQGAFHGFLATGAASNNMLTVYSSGSAPNFTVDLELVNIGQVIANNTAISTNWALITVTRAGSGPYTYTLWVNKTKVASVFATKIVDSVLLVGLYWNFSLYQAMRAGRMARWDSLQSDATIEAWVDEPRAAWADAVNRWEMGDTPGDSTAPGGTILDVGTAITKVHLSAFNMTAGDIVTDSP